MGLISERYESLMTDYTPTADHMAWQFTARNVVAQLAK
jgi:hypothetical protein